MTKRGVFLAPLVLAVLALAMAPALAASDVRCMPDRQVRPGVSLPAFGAAGNVGIGDGSANGENYTWSFGVNPNVTVTDDGSLAGVVANDRYIVEAVTFTLGGGSTREIVTGTLDVGGTTCTVKIDIVDPTDPISDTPDENLLVDVNIAVEDGLRFIYRNQDKSGGVNDGSWDGYSSSVAYRVASTGLCAWAMNNSGHAPDQGTIYSPSTQQGLDWIFGNTQNVDISGHAGSNFNNHLAGTRGLDPVGPIGTSREDYAAGMAAGGIISTLLPGATVGSGGGAGLTYKQYIEEYADWAAYGQHEANCGLAPPNEPCGGWDYESNDFPFSFASADDLSINSWMYVSLEGAEAVFGAAFNPRIKNIIDDSLVNRQEDGTGFYGMGYCSANSSISCDPTTQPTDPCPGAGAGTCCSQYGHYGYRSKTGVYGRCSPAYATTCGGLAGQALEQLPANITAPNPDYSAGLGGLNTHAAKRQAALDHLGRHWARSPLGVAWLRGNHGNHYAMWTCCRALRLNSVTQLVNDGYYGGAVGPFNWETSLNTDGVTDGYWPFLVNTQKTTGVGCSSGMAGCWQQGLSQYNDNFDTCTAILCLQQTVFGPPEEPCPEDPDPRTQGYWHRQCLGLPESEGGIDPGRNGRGPKSPTEPGFVDELMPCADARLEDLGFDTDTTCSGMDADPPSDKCEKALKQLTALILNVCSERLLDGCEVDVSAEGCTSTNVGDLIQEITDLIDSGDCHTASSCAAAVNEGDALVSDGGGDFGYSVDEPVRPRSIRNVDLDDDESKQRRRSIRREKVGDGR